MPYSFSGGTLHFCQHLLLHRTFALLLTAITFWPGLSSDAASFQADASPQSRDSVCVGGTVMVASPTVIVDTGTYVVIAAGASHATTVPATPAAPPSGGTAGADDATTVPATPASPSSEDAATASGESATIEIGDMFFQPSELTIPAEVPFELTLTNVGTAPHSFVIDQFEIVEALAPGQETEVTLTATAGSYEFYDCLPGHREAGMVGTLIVVEESARSLEDA